MDNAVSPTDTRVLAGRLRLAHSAHMTFLKFTILYGFLLTLLACGSDAVDPKGGDAVEDAGDPEDDTADEDDGASKPTGSTKDAGGAAPSGAKDAGSPPSAAKDAGAPKPEARDSGAPADGGTTLTGDAGKSVDGGEAAKDGGGGLMFPDLFPAAPDAGTSTGAPATGTRDPNGPCKDLMLFCFDPIDMFLFNAECFTCNGGKGCEGCAIPFAY